MEQIHFYAIILQKLVILDHCSLLHSSSMHEIQRKFRKFLIIFIKYLPGLKLKVEFKRLLLKAL